MANIKQRAFNEISTQTAVFENGYSSLYPPSRKFVPNFVLLYSCLHLGSYTKRNKKQTVPILFERFNLEYAWIRQPRSGSCHYPTAVTKCNEQPSQATATPSVEEHAHPPRVVYCAIYSTLTRFTKSRV